MEKIGLNKKLVSVILIFFVLFVAFPYMNIEPVKASIVAYGSEISVEDVQANNEGGVSASSSSHIFYAESVDRWYVGYVVRDGVGDEFMYYSYSDVGDPTQWNNGGKLTYLTLGNVWTNYLKSPYHMAWCWDDKNEVGHAISNVVTAGSIRYYNFTIDGGTGAIVLGALKWIFQPASGTYPIQLDIITDGTYVYIGSTGYHNGVNAGITCTWIFEWNNYSNMTMYYWQPYSHAYTSTMLMPIEVGKVIQFATDASAANPIRYKVIEDGVTTNGTGTGTVFSDLNVYQFTGTNGYKISSWGGSYNVSHGCIAYSDFSSKDVYAFIFDFETFTKTDEYLALDISPTGITVSADVTMNLNEFFVFAISGSPSISPKHMHMTEQHNPSYDGFFNASGAVTILSGFATDWDYTYMGCGISKFTDPDDVALILFEDGDWAKVTYATVVGEYPTPEPFDFDVSADLEDVDDDGADWVFTDWKYYRFTVSTNLSALDNASISFTVPTGEENINCGFWSDGDDWIYSSNMTYESREGEPGVLKAGTWNETSGELTFDIWFESRILDVWDPSGGIAIYGSYNASAWFLISANFFRIYSKGGFEMNFASTGTAGKLAGGTPFSLYGNNGSIVYNEIWYRDGQHIKLMPDIHFLTGLEPFYIRYGVDYSLGDGEWLEGWSLYINPKFVSYTGVFAANVWINMTNFWNYRNVSGYASKDLYMFYHGSVSGAGDPGHWKSWVDLWVSDKSASKVGAGRYNAYEFPMIDLADLWLRWLANNWGVKDNVFKEMSVQIPLLDTDNSTVISSEQIKMVRFWCELEIDDTDSGQYVSIENYEAFDVTRSRDLPLVGMSDPIFDETLLPTVGQRGILGALFTLFAGFGQWMSENVIFGGLNLWSTFVNFLDTIAAMFGAPKFFTNLFVWMAELLGYLVESAGYIGTIATSLFSLIGALLGAFLTTMGDLISSIVNTITMFNDMMAGGYGVGVDIWETFGIGQWITVAMIFYPLYLFILWDQEGMDAVIKQLTMLFGILSWLFYFFVDLIQFTIRLVTTVIESIPVAE